LYTLLFKNIHTLAMDLMNQCRQLLISKGYCSTTVNLYASIISRFVTELSQVQLPEIGVRHIKGHLERRIDERTISISTQKQILSALSFFYRDFLCKEVDLSQLYPKSSNQSSLPSILSVQETQSLLTGVKNLKHKTMLCTVYSLGLRLEELLNLKIADIDQDMLLVTIHKAGKKDRQVRLCTRLLNLLRAYYKDYCPYDYVFEGRNGGRYSASAVQTVMRTAVTVAGLDKTVTVQTLRHSFAAHLVELGIDLRVVQELLGHSSIKTTQVYARLAKRNLARLANPLEQIHNIL